MANEEFPPNSNRQREIKKSPAKKDEKERLAPVVQGSVQRRKRSLGRRFSDAFISDSAESSVGSYVLFDILVPAFRDMVIDAGTGALERTFGGGGYHPSARRRRGGERFDYSGVSRRREDPRDRPKMSDRGRRMHDFDEIVLNSRMEAMEVLDKLNFRLDKYDMVTVMDLYDLVGETASWTDQKWGWFDLDAATVTRIRGGGYLLNLPRPEPIDYQRAEKMIQMFIPAILDVVDCDRHNAPLGVPCWNFPRYHGYGYYPAICNKRAQRGNMRSPVSARATTRVRGKHNPNSR